jgi:hypothetical protein
MALAFSRIAPATASHFFSWSDVILSERLERDDALLDGFGLVAGGGRGGRRLLLGGLRHRRAGEQRGADQRRDGQGPQDRLADAKIGHGIPSGIEFEGRTGPAGIAGWAQG